MIRERGFTLVELLVVLALVVILAGLGAGGLRAIKDAHDRHSAQALLEQAFALARQTARACATRVTLTLAAGDPHLRIQSADGRLQRQQPLPGGLAASRDLVWRFDAVGQLHGPARLTLHGRATSLSLDLAPDDPTQLAGLAP